MFSWNLINIFKGGPRNIRQQLLRDIMLLVCAIIVVLFVIGYYLGGNLRRQASAAIITDTSVLVKKKFYSFTEPVENYLTIGYLWGKSGLLTSLEAPELCQIFIPMLSTHSYIAAVSIADSRGNEFFLKRDGDQWLTRHSAVVNGKRLGHWQEWLDAGQPLKSWDQETNYDPRQRPWFRQTLNRKPGTIHWTDPYHFFSSDKQGVTASIAWHDPRSNVFSVMAFDLLEDDLLAFLNGLATGDRGHIILLARDGSIIVHNRSNRLRRIEDSPAVIAAIKHWRNKKQQKIEVFEFSVGGRTWWAGFSPLKEDKLSAWIAIIVPENEIMGSVKKQWFRITAAATLVLIIGVILALFLVRKYSYQLRDLPRQKIHEHNFAEELQSLIAAGESPSLEFKSTIRKNLKTGKHGKEIELAWLKTVVAFMNSDGGILLLGVNDQGEITGIEADEFDNEDRCRLHCKNLINNHIGPEFSRFIHLKIHHLQGKTLVVIECERVRRPVFLTVGKNEDFFVRSGPSSIKLTMSQMVDYLNERR
ncbi:MAG: putative DNA binding domain-containing protein [Deltaproteobacteria bacterium]|nr:putative DNA binding domain-containing protein [Deltaproteobacteria bacterium]